MSEPIGRKPIHTRRIEYTSYLRDDGLFEIEGRLVDTMSMAGNDMHDMTLRVTFDDSMVLRSAETTLVAGPFSACHGDPNLFDRVVGERISPGWKQRVSRKIGRVESCTHQVELLFSMATVAYEALSMAPEVNGIDPFDHLRSLGSRPHFLDGCRAWQTTGELVRKVFPDFATPRKS